jgi:serine/threonine protein kinase
VSLASFRSLFCCCCCCCCCFVLFCVTDVQILDSDVFYGRVGTLDVACKMLKANFSDEQLQTFFDECNVFAAIPQHQFVVGFVGAIPSPFTIVSELCPMGSLKSFLRRHGSELSVAQELKVVRDIADGMAFLNSHQILHRE